jgi:very-short-patch-repair endonuclease
MRDEIPTKSLPQARVMRRESTDAERKLWSCLRDRRLGGLKFRRQVPVGPFIADFLCVEHMLIVEVDGSQHFESSRDLRRDEWLHQHGYAVLRIWNVDVLKNLDSVKATIMAACRLAW